MAFSDSDFVTTEEDKSEDQQLPRTSRAAALDRIEKENTEADEIIPETSIAENNNNGSIITPEVIRLISTMTNSQKKENLENRKSPQFIGNTPELKKISEKAHLKRNRLLAVKRKQVKKDLFSETKKKSTEVLDSDEESDVDSMLFSVGHFSHEESIKELTDDQEISTNDYVLVKLHRKDSANREYG